MWKIEDGRNPEPKVTSVEAFELRKQPKELEKEKLGEYLKAKRTLLHNGYQTSSPDAQKCDQAVLNGDAEKVTRQQRESKLMEKATAMNPQPQKQQSQEIQR